jgi:hypothetical protein
VSKILPLLLLRRRDEVSFLSEGAARARSRASAVFLKLFSSLFPKSSSEQILQKKRSERERESLYSICGYPCGRVREKNSAAARVQNKETRFISSFSSLSVSLCLTDGYARGLRKTTDLYHYSIEITHKRKKREEA